MGKRRLSWRKRDVAIRTRLAIVTAIAEQHSIVAHVRRSCKKTSKTIPLKEAARGRRWRQKRNWKRKRKSENRKKRRREILMRARVQEAISERFIFAGSQMFVHVLHGLCHRSSFSSRQWVVVPLSLLYSVIVEREKERVKREQCSPVRRIRDRSSELEDDSRSKRVEPKERGLREKSGTKRNEEETDE